MPNPKIIIRRTLGHLDSGSIQQLSDSETMDSILIQDQDVFSSFYVGHNS